MLSCRGTGAPPRRGASLPCSIRSTTTLAPSARLLMPTLPTLLRASSSPGSGASPNISSSSSQQRRSGSKTLGAAPGPSWYSAAERVAPSVDIDAAPSDSTNVPPAAVSSSAKDEKPFSWTSAWYPVTVEADLPKDRPVPIKLLGRRLVLWWAGEGESEGGASDGHEKMPSSKSKGGGYWSCLDDACSHRLAPLSEGRIDKNCVSCNSSNAGKSGGENAETCRALSCSYHGFAFAGDGAAVSVPQARHDGGVEAERRAARSPRARVRSYPTLALDQLVWVWGSGGDEAAKEAAEAPLPPGPPDRIRRLMLEAAEETPTPRERGGGRGKGSAPPLVALITNQQYFRDLPVPYDEMMTNLADQSHVPFAHTGVASNRDSPFANHFTVSNVNAHLKEEERDDGEEEKEKTKGKPRRRFSGVAAADLITFDLEWAPDALALAKQNVVIAPPCYIEYSTPLQRARDLEAAAKTAAVEEIGLRACLWFYATPLDASTTRIFNNAVVVAHSLPAWAARLVNGRPKWVDHLFLQNVLDGDVAYLPQAAANEKLGFFSNYSSTSSASAAVGGGEEEEEEERGARRVSSSPLVDARGELWARRYFMPANADASVVAWRRWLQGGRGRSGWLDAVADGAGRVAGGGKGSNSASSVGSARVDHFPALSSSSSFSKSRIPLPPADLPRSELFDRWSQHTKHCPSCSRAMERAQRVKMVLEVSAAVSGLFASSAALLLLLSTASSSATGGGGAGAAQGAFIDAPLLLRVLLSSSALAALSLLGRRAAATLETWFVFKDYEHWKS